MVTTAVPVGLGASAASAMALPLASSIVTWTIQVPGATLTSRQPGVQSPTVRIPSPPLLAPETTIESTALRPHPSAAASFPTNDQVTCKVPSWLQAPPASAASIRNAGRTFGMRGLYHCDAPPSGETVDPAGETTKTAGVCVSVSPQLVMLNELVCGLESAVPLLSKTLIDT